MKVGVFLHGTAIMHATAAGVGRDERVQQVRRRDPSVREFTSYIPTPGTAVKLAAWQQQGASLIYLSSHRRPEDLRADEAVIRRHGFPEGPVHGRAEAEDYGALVERLGLDALVEEDCEKHRRNRTDVRRPTDRRRPPITPLHRATRIHRPGGPSRRPGRSAHAG